MPANSTNIVLPKYHTELMVPFTLPLVVTMEDNYDVKRCQEWLVLHGEDIKVDGDYGPSTALAVAKFKHKANIGNPGDRDGAFIDKVTWDSLSLPLQRATFLAIGHKDSFGDNVVRVARQYLQEHPREVGGDNRGVWQRHFSRGREGQPWCQDFATTVWMDAARNLGLSNTPFPLCDTNLVPSSYVPWVADQARAAGALVYGHSGQPKIRPGSMFFVRVHGAGYTHVGIVTKDMGETFQTIEGNTNDEGSANGYEVCERTRPKSSCDFAQLVD